MKEYTLNEILEYTLLVKGWTQHQAEDFVNDLDTFYHDLNAFNKKE